MGRVAVDGIDIAAERDLLLAEVDRLERELVWRVAETCARRGHRQIVLWGTGPRAAATQRQPWTQHGIRAVGAVAAGETDAGFWLPVLEPARAAEFETDAVVVMTEDNEYASARSAERVFGPLGVPVLRVGGGARHHVDQRVREAPQLIREFGVPIRDAEWLVANRLERHDATLPMLYADRTELHLRRYELAARDVDGAEVLDAASGTGYGSALLGNAGAARVRGVDTDADAVGYASKHHASDRVSFAVGDAGSLAFADGSFDLIASFETIEHVPDAAGVIDEFARVLRPGGTLVMSTPNDWGLSEHHVHSFTRESLCSLLDPRFEIRDILGQRAGDRPRGAGLPAGIYVLGEGAPEPESLIVRARNEHG